MGRRISRLARRGTAKLVVPSRSDNFATVGAARHLYRRLLKSCLAIYEYRPQKLHAKLLAIDDIGYAGSANFDKRSLFLNLEIMLRVEDRRFADAIRTDIDAMAQHSRPIDEAVFKAMDGRSGDPVVVRFPAGRRARLHGDAPAQFPPGNAGR